MYINNYIPHCLREFSETSLFYDQLLHQASKLESYKSFKALLKSILHNKYSQLTTVLLAGEKYLAKKHILK